MTAKSSPDTKRQMLRHTIATLAYRGGKTIRGAPDSFINFRPGEEGRTAGQILAHIGDLLDWGLSIAKGEQTWKNSSPLDWPQESARFFAASEAFETYLASEEPLHVPAEKLFQGPIADALTHVGQLMMMRRLSGSPARGENYFVAEITTGRAGADQAAPVREF